MLNKEERFKILKLIRHCCIIGCLPATIDFSSWKLLQQTGRKRWLGLAYFGFFVLHSMYKIATLCGDCIAEIGTPLHQLILHAMLALSAPFVTFWYYQLFIEHPGAPGSYLHMTLTGTIGRMTADSKEKTKGVGRLKAYTPQDFVVVNFPYMIALAVVAIIGTAFYSPTLTLLLYAGLPEHFQTWLSFTILGVEEMRYVFMVPAVGAPMLALQIISFDLVNSRLSSLIGSIKQATTRLQIQQAYRSLRHMQHYVTLVNDVNRYLIFSWKFFCIGVCIGTGYAAIAHFGDYPIFGIMYYVVVIQESFVYTVGYDKAFRIPELFQEVAQQAVLRYGMGDFRGTCILKRQMRSIPRIMIKVGDFHVLERESTPIFLHYVWSNIVSMLVAYRH